jgi:oligosaccharide translocation protein RFT1
MVDLKTNVRVRAEGLGITAKSILTFLILLYDSREGSGDFALVAFAVGQLAYSVVMFLTYTVSFGWGVIQPKKPSSPGYVVISPPPTLISDLRIGTPLVDTSTRK